MVSSPSAPTTAYAVCQPTCCPSQVATGTPTTLATVRPMSTLETAWVRCRSSTSEAATREAIPKYAPCGSPATKRTAISAG